MTATFRMPAKGERIALVAGLRTPFARQLTHYRSLSSIDLGKLVVTELLARLNLDAALIDRLVFGQVLALPEAPNIAREIVLGTGMRVQTDAYSLSRACATSFQSVADVAQSLMAGDIQIGLAGGADSSSIVPIQASRKLADTLVQLQKARSVGDKLKLLADLRPKDLAPVPPAVKDYSTGLSMGESAEQMARDHGISRADQDALAHRSHTLAAKAWAEGKLNDEVMVAHVPPFKAPLHQDNVIRTDSTLEAYAKLKPAFDRQHGTVTAGNATPLSDGAAVILMMREDVAKAHGYEPLGFLRSYAFTANRADIDGLIGPSYATPKALDRAGLTLADLTLIDMHEAFAAQTLANIKAFGSRKFAEERLGRSEAIGEIDMDKLNVLGGSIAYGHPFAATGARMLTQVCRELKRRGGGLGLTTACAAGGIGAAMIVEVE